MLGAVVIGVDYPHLVRGAPADPTGALRDEGWAEGLGAQCGPPAPINSAIPGFRLGRYGRHDGADAALS